MTTPRSADPDPGDEQRRDRHWRQLAEGAFAGLAARPTHGDPHLEWLAIVALERLGHLDEAGRRCDALLEAVPDHLGAALTRASLYARSGQRGGAMMWLERVAMDGPDPLVVAHLRRAVGGGDFSAPLMAEVTELFDRYAPRFEQHLVDELGYRGHLAVASDGLAACRGDALEVLDLGCGSGLCAAALDTPRVSRLTGVDLSTRMLELAARSVDWRRDYDVLFAADVVYALWTLPPDCMDLMLAADVLGYLGDLDAVLRQAHRVLRPGGVLAFSVEADDEVERFALRPSRRCCYEGDWVEARARAAGFELHARGLEALRQEARQQVCGHLFTLRRPGP